MTRLIETQHQRICFHCVLLIALLIPGSALASTWQLFSARSRASSAAPELFSLFPFLPPGSRDPAACCLLQSSR